MHYAQSGSLDDDNLHRIPNTRLLLRVFHPPSMTAFMGIPLLVNANARWFVTSTEELPFSISEQAKEMIKGRSRATFFMDLLAPSRGTKYMYHGRIATNQSVTAVYEILR
jgi:hypothetical protein